jgi:hypothetical protein
MHQKVHGRALHLMIRWLLYVNVLNIVQFISCHAQLYSGGSYHLSRSRGATAIFKFRGKLCPMILSSYYASMSIIGTGFAILGGRRPGYGPFSLSLDGRHLYEGNPVPDPSSSINNTLAVVANLSYDDHTLVFTNSGGASVDIDAITFEAEIGPTRCVRNTIRIMVILTHS